MFGFDLTDGSFARLDFVHEDILMMEWLCGSVQSGDQMRLFFH